MVGLWGHAGGVAVDIERFLLLMFMSSVRREDQKSRKAEKRPIVAALRPQAKHVRVASLGASN